MESVGLGVRGGSGGRGKRERAQPSGAVAIAEPVKRGRGRREDPGAAQGRFPAFGAMIVPPLNEGRELGFGQGTVLLLRVGHRGMGQGVAGESGERGLDGCEERGEASGGVGHEALLS